MLRSTFLLAILVGLATAIPLNDTQLMDDSVEMEQSALLIPETEFLTNQSIVLESMPKIEKSVHLANEDAEQMEEKMEEKVISIEDKVIDLKERMVKEQIEFEKSKRSLSNELALNEELKESELKTELEILELAKELKSHLKIDKNATRFEIAQEYNQFESLKKQLEKENEEVRASEAKLEDDTVLLEKMLENLKMKELKFTKLVEKLSSNSTIVQEMKSEIVKIAEKMVKQSESLTQIVSKAMVSTTTEEMILNATAPEFTLNSSAPMVLKALPLEAFNVTLLELNSTTQEMVLESLNVTSLNATTPEVETEIEDEDDDEEDDDEDDEDFELEEKEVDLDVRSILNKVVTIFDDKKEKLDDYILNDYCRSEEKFKYYRSHPTSEDKYVECNPWGKGTVKTCPLGRIWDEFHEICSTPEVMEISKNLTADFLQLEKMGDLYKTVENVNCNNSDYKCMNGGECVAISEDEYECKCTKRFFGFMCEHRALKNSIFTQIMTEKFDLKEFKSKLARVFNSKKINMEDMEQVKKEVTETSHEEIMSYLDNFQNGEIRYDMVLNNLIENILEDIYPDAYYLSSFNASSHTLLDVVRTIPSLISYTKYSGDRFAEVFFKYQEVLGMVVENLNSTWTNARRDATDYIKISNHIMNATHIDLETFSRTNLTDINMSLDANFNRTQEADNYMMELEVLRRNLIKEMIMRPAMINTKLCDMTQKVQIRDLISIFDSVANSSVEIINSLFSYGFWLVTDSFAQHF